MSLTFHLRLHGIELTVVAMQEGKVRAHVQKIYHFPKSLGSLFDAPQHLEQVGTIILGFVLTLVGFLILTQYAALRQGKSPLRRVAQFALLGMIASLAGAIGNFIQTIASSSLGVIIGTLAGGAMVGLLGVCVDALLEALTNMPPARLAWIGRFAFAIGIIVEVLQGSILLLAPKLP